MNGATSAVINHRGATWLSGSRAQPLHRPVSRPLRRCTDPKLIAYGLETGAVSLESDARLDVPLPIDQIRRHRSVLGASRPEPSTPSSPSSVSSSSSGAASAVLVQIQLGADLMREGDHPSVDVPSRVTDVSLAASSTDVAMAIPRPRVQASAQRLTGSIRRRSARLCAPRAHRHQWPQSWGCRAANCPSQRSW